uniref:PLD phosphodiesterase domain-containing protein n=1 Tax=Romanomermis culicivorax TaxID=13658 RepID=A0A915IM17_ROMCU
MTKFKYRRTSKLNISDNTDELIIARKRKNKGEKKILTDVLLLKKTKRSDSTESNSTSDSFCIHSFTDFMTSRYVLALTIFFALLSLTLISTFLWRYGTTDIRNNVAKVTGLFSYVAKSQVRRARVQYFKSILVKSFSLTSLWLKSCTGRFGKEASVGHQRRNTVVSQQVECSRSCQIEIVESIPETLPGVWPKMRKLATDGDETSSIKTTFESWKELMNLAENNLHIAAYKSSLRAKHVINSTDQNPSTAMGEEIFRLLTEMKTKNRNVSVKMVENYPPRDLGDNEDGLSLEKRGIVERRALHFKRMFGGAMHSKFLVVDSKHFYLGSANFDWRSLNQKYEIGVLVKNCSCLAKDLQSIFASYWRLSMQNVTNGTNIENLYSTETSDITFKNPLKLLHKGVDPTNVYLATSPPHLNTKDRTWDLDGILDVINRAEQFLYINVMDYVPMFLYAKPRRYWPVIDNAVRRAVIERGVELKLISAALHFVPQNLKFLQSLEALNGLQGSVHIKILRVPSETEFHRMFARDRRTHRKFMVTENDVVIGTSNWSGDYFHSSTGVQIFIQQNHSSVIKNYGPLIKMMRHLFLRDWNSENAHDINFYVKTCVSQNGDIIESKNKVCEPLRT